MNPFSFPAIGLDISDESFKYLAYRDTKGGREIDFFGERAIQAGIVETGEIKNPAQLGSILKEELSKYRRHIPYMAVSLPEEKGFVRLIKTERIAPKDLKSALAFQLEEHIPYPPADLVFDCEVINPDKKNTADMEVVVTAYPHEVVESYMGVVTRAGFVPIVLELESQAIARAVVPNNFKEAAIVGDIGRTRTTFSIVYNGLVYFTSTIKIGGRDIDNILMQTLHISEEEAREVKIGRGFDANSEDIMKSLSPLIGSLKEQIDRDITFWRHRYPEKSANVARVFLCGGDAQLKGLAEYLGREVGITVKRSRPWENIFDIETYIPSLHARETLRYATTLGLALRGGALSL